MGKTFRAWDMAQARRLSPSVHDFKSCAASGPRLDAIRSCPARRRAGGPTRPSAWPSAVPPRRRLRPRRRQPPPRARAATTTAEAGTRGAAPPPTAAPVNDTPRGSPQPRPPQPRPRQLHRPEPPDHEGQGWLSFRPGTPRSRSMDHLGPIIDAHRLSKGRSRSWPAHAAPRRHPANCAPKISRPMPATPWKPNSNLGTSGICGCVSTRPERPRRQAAATGRGCPQGPR